MLRNIHSATQADKQRMLEYLEEHHPLFDYFLIRSAEDGNQDVRNQARQCVKLYHKLLPRKCEDNIIYGLKSSTFRKEMIDELELNENAEGATSGGQRHGIHVFPFTQERKEAIAEIVTRLVKVREMFDQALTSQQFLIAFKQLKSMRFEIEQSASTSPDK